MVVREMVAGKSCFEYETFHEGENKILKIYTERCPFPPSIEYSEICMGKVVDILLNSTGITTIILSQLREYEYDYPQCRLLLELTVAYKQLNREGNFTRLVTNPLYERYIRGNFAGFQRLISKRLKEDPFAAFVELKRLEVQERAIAENLLDERHAAAHREFLRALHSAIQLLEQLSLLRLLLPHSKSYRVGQRDIYGNVFHPTTRPDFMYTKLVSAFPEGNLEESYALGEGTPNSGTTGSAVTAGIGAGSAGKSINAGKKSSFDGESSFGGSDGWASQVNIFSFDGDSKILYHLTPPEFRFSEEVYELLDDAKRIMAEHKPTREEFVNPERMREVFYSIGKDLLQDLAKQKKLNISEEEIEEIARALLRYTVGFGLIEILLSDHKVQDVNINAPTGELPVFIVHQDYGDCCTNIYPTRLEVESWATKLRLISGRPLDEANPILDTELKVEGFTSRVAALTAPLSPTGLAFSFRRHRDYPWTFPLYLQPKIRYLNPMAAGLLSFLLDQNATILVAGTRSSGKTSLLGSFLTGILRRTRILTIEDTFELPGDSLRALGYNLESLKVASALSAPGSEVDPSIGIRSTLRLGDSAIFVGEVRSKEAVALFEAMRVGAAANVVAGTIHADSPYGVYDRVVNDIGVPKTSFKAIDIIVVTNPVISGLKKFKRVLRITEVRKEWENDPLQEKAFVDLMTYNPVTDELEVTDELKNGNSEILKRMAGRVKEFAGDWDAVWENILLRAEVQKAIVELFLKHQDSSLLEAEFVISANDMLHLIMERVKGREGKSNLERVLFEFREWLEKTVKKRRQ